MVAYIIKELLYSDLEQAARVIRQGFATVAKDFGLTINNCPTNGAFIKVNKLISDKEKGNLLYGLYAENQMIGFMQLEKKDAQYELEKVTVLPQYRHFGYGKVLLDFSKSKAKELGATKLCIGIIEENAKLKQWYCANGFFHTGTVNYDFLPFTVGFMEFEINQELSQ